MPVLPIVTGADSPILRAKTKPVTKITREIVQLLKDMQETTVHADGLGLAAPQVNRSERVCIVRLHGKFIPLINPEILSKSDDEDMAEEGCLSLPGQWMMVPRATSIVLRYQDIKGKEQERLFEAIDARIIQHEVDHLEGVLILDYVTK